MCGAPDQDLNTELMDAGSESVIQGTVVRAGQPLPGAYVRLLDGTGEFTAEVVSSATGGFRFFAAPGDWTLRTLAPGQTVDTAVTAQQGKAVVAEVDVPA